MIAIIVAEDVIETCIKNVMGGVQSVSIGNLTGFRGKLGVYDTMVFDVSISGSNNIRKATREAIKGYENELDVVINIGTAGALTKALPIDSLYEVKECIQFDVQPGTNPIKSVQPAVCRNRTRNLSVIPGYHLCRVATGDRFVATKQDADLLVNKYQADICDEECAAVVEECLARQVPVYAFKVLTNFLGGKAPAKQHSRRKAKSKYTKIVARHVADIVHNVANAETLAVIGNDWDGILSDFFHTPEFRNLRRFLKNEYNGNDIFPQADDIFRCFKCPRFEDVRCVIVGQDPYPTPGNANGVPFSYTGNPPIPKTLENIFTEIYYEYGIVEPKDNGDLTKWTKQGVLLLNAALTIRGGCPGSHVKSGWGDFIWSVLKYIAENKDDVVFLLWGEEAGKNEKEIKKIYGSKPIPTVDNVFSCDHPSVAQNGGTNPFFGCDHFKKVNDFFVSRGLPEINWDLN